MENRRGLTMIELLVGMMVMMITLSAARLSMNSVKQTPKREAERIVAYLTRLTQKADRIQVSFDVVVEDGEKMSVKWAGSSTEEESLTASRECSYSTYNFTQVDTAYKMTYNYINYPMGAKIFVSESASSYTDITKQRYITITAKGESSCYVIITANTK